MEKKPIDDLILEWKLICRKELGTTDAEFFSMTPRQARSLLGSFRKIENDKLLFKLKFQDILHAELKALILNVNKDPKKGRVAKPKDFLHFKEEKTYPTAEEMLIRLKGITAQIKVKNGSR